MKYSGSRSIVTQHNVAYTRRTVLCQEYLPDIFSFRSCNDLFTVVIIIVKYIINSRFSWKFNELKNKLMCEENGGELCTTPSFIE